MISEDNDGMIKELVVGKKRGQYSPRVRCFALSLSFYSQKAYLYVKKYFKKLPALSTIKSWYRSIDGEPSLSDEAREAIFNRLDAMESLVYMQP